MDIFTGLRDFLGDSGASADRQLDELDRKKRLAEARLAAFQAEQSEQIARESSLAVVRTAVAQAQARADIAAVDAYHGVAGAHVAGRRTLADALRAEAEESIEQEYYISTLAAVRSLSPEDAVARIEKELVTERALLPYRFARSARQALPSVQQSTDLATAARAIAGAIPTGPGGPTQATVVTPDTPALQPYFSADAVEQLSLKALARCGGLPSPQADAAFARFEDESRLRLPAAAAEAVIARVRQLRGVTQSDDE